MTQTNPFGAAAVPSELLSRVEAAAYLGVAKQTLAIWACTNRYDLPYVKIGKLVKYRLYRFGSIYHQEYSRRIGK